MKKNRIIIFIALFLIFCFAFFIRTYFSYKVVFSGGVVKYTEDAMYHMRVLENLVLGGHFPFFANFDPYVNFPHGAYNNIAPLFDFILAGIILLVSFGAPTMELVNKAAPFYPVILGSLIPIVIYFIAKTIWDDVKVSLTSSFLSAISAPLIFKSFLGYNDHHVAEVLLSSLSVLFLLSALNSAKNGTGIKNKKLWLFVFLCGFSMGFYLLAWAGAILLFFLIFVFLFIYYLIEFISKKPCGWILAVGVIIFAIPALMILPIFGLPNITSGTYNINHAICFFLAMAGFFLLWLFGDVIKRKKINRWLIIVFLAVFTLLSLVVFKLFFPYIFEKIMVLANGINNNAIAFMNVRDFVGEMMPLRFQGAVDNFSSMFFFFIVGFFIVIYDFIRNRNPVLLFLIIWSAFTFLIAGIIPYFGQFRFIVYFAVNVALLAGFVATKGLEFGFKALRISSRMDKKEYSFRNYFLISSIVALFSLVFLIVYPFPFNTGHVLPGSLPDIASAAYKMAKDPFALKPDWYDVFDWLEKNTPDTGLDYYALYSDDYQYPPEAYGILANWDYGHAIEYYAHRPVIANPFQMGIGKKENDEIAELGSAIFFVETDEKKAISYLDQMRAKYVITDDKFSTLKYFNGLVEWLQGNMEGYIDQPESSLTKYDKSMLIRLHFSDGSETVIEKKLYGKIIDLTVGALSYFRLIYESATTTNLFLYKNSAKEVKLAKVFEYVNGAKIKGRAPVGSAVEISTEVTTNQNRKFVYKNSIIAKDGSFEFVVPYATGKQANSDVLASEYIVKIGGFERKVKVLEKDILEGKEINLF